ncbi:hypothetical protein LCGC14_1881500 [marine sediment metagenome]|uniref:Uncharacterized protein n=1 Tax=marine sediment metagenome TaxID=412755 RepID=A0A0F9G270_9ZZZZ
MRYKYICPECGKDTVLWSNAPNTLRHYLCPNCRLRVDIEATPSYTELNELFPDVRR